MRQIFKIISHQFLRSIFILCLAIGLLTVSSLQNLVAEASPEWGYEGALDGNHWGRLSPDFATCELGKKQSPIDITRAIKGTPAQIVFHYRPTPLVVLNNGHTIQVNYVKGSTVTIDRYEYELLQFHFHTPSEHTIGGKTAPMEMHLVHRNAAGKLAVIGVMLDTGEANPLIDRIWEHIPAVGQTNTVSDRAIDATDLLPKSKAHFSYNGSLTTPPCSESVEWHVMASPVTISAKAIKRFQALYPLDARSIQPTNGRLITFHPE
jgi:carbonic anhydrase